MKILDFLLKENIPYHHLEIYREAFTHSSYANEAHRHQKDYERLEFMGDAVLQLYVSEFLFKYYPHKSEGELTTLRSKLVREEALARFARELGLGELIYLGVGEQRSGGRDRESVLADIFESFIGALYLDSGVKSVIRILEKTIYKHVYESNYEDFVDYKTKLQELVQADERRTVVYTLLSETGPSNAPLFKVAVRMDQTTLGVGEGTSKKRAEQEAARDALKKLAKTDLDI